MADLGAVPDLVPNVLRFELAAATAVAALAIRGPAEEQKYCSLPMSLIMSSPSMFSLSICGILPAYSCLSLSRRADGEEILFVVYPA